MKELDFSNNVNRIKCPTLVICGKKDSANMKSAYYLADNIPNAKLKIIENTGHIVNEENPKIFSRNIKRNIIVKPNKTHHVYGIQKDNFRFIGQNNI